MKTKVLVTGAGGFIGHHLVKYLKRNGYWVRGVDIKKPQYEETEADEFQILDLRSAYSCHLATEGMDHVYSLAADMGGIGYIYEKCAEPASNNIRINVNMLEAAKRNGVGKYLFSSSACVYPVYKQTEPNSQWLREDDVNPADPDHGYGWEKLFTEKLCLYFHHDFGFNTKIVRLHNVYGPLGTYDGGREKAPAALCRKIANCRTGDVLEIWGDGEQTRSFMYIDDCVEGMLRVQLSSCNEPLNLGTEDLISITTLASLIETIAGKQLVHQYDKNAPQGVRGRCSDNRRIREVLGWEPKIPLEYGLAETYRWIASQLHRDEVPGVFAQSMVSNPTVF